MRAQRSSRDNSVITTDIKKEFTQFLQRFGRDPQNDRVQPKYLNKISSMIEAGKHLLIIEYQDFISYNCDLANLVFDEYYKYQPILNQALNAQIRELEKRMNEPLQYSKREDQKQQKYQITFDSSINSGEQASVRDLRCNKLGQLFSFRGTVTRTTQVRPQLISGVFFCKNCLTYSKPTVQQFKYTEPKKCFGKNCDKPVWEINLQKSQFADFQKLRVQQDPTKIPPGAMPRSIDVILRNQCAQKGQPGDICKFIGYLCVLPQIISMLKPGQKTTINSRNLQTRGQMMDMEGVKGVKGIRQLNYKLIFIATNLIIQNNQFREDQQIDDDQLSLQRNEHQSKEKFHQDQIIRKIFSKLTEQQIKMMMEFKQNVNLYDDMAHSLFPSIFGQTQIKKAILLQLFGGIHKITKNKISIRGDLNILIVGDPSTAKSQFLKAVNKFVPRSVYTNGKTTSAAGLTATVTKDETGSVGIQAGALMLADNGVCCIDQFDKMNYKDQTAIHEAMQQQTISIAKAGVYATLNARTSILAAANPIFGRYDKSKSLKDNLNISPPIMSRFDLFFIVCDETNDNSDANLSEFIINMHRNKQKAILSKYDSKGIKLYISTAKKLKPMITQPAAIALRKYYIELRMKDKSMQNTSYKVTVRQLESMIRISQALARLNLDTQVKQSYVQQAYRLITTSIMKLEKSPVNLIDQQADDVETREKLQQIIKGEIALERQFQQKKKQKANKQISISFQLYQIIQKSVIQLFKSMQSKQKNQLVQGDPVQISHQSIMSFLLAKLAQDEVISTEQQTLQMRKIINAVIKKLIRQQRVLMIVEDSSDPTQKILKMHPNFAY